MGKVVKGKEAERYKITPLGQESLAVGDDGIRVEPCYVTRDNRKHDTLEQAQAHNRIIDFGDWYVYRSESMGYMPNAISCNGHYVPVDSLIAWLLENAEHVRKLIG